MIDDDLAGIPCALGSLLLVAALVVALWSAFRDDQADRTNVDAASADGNHLHVGSTVRP